MKRYNVYGIGNGIMDILLSVSEAEFKPLSYEKGSMTLVSSDEQQMLLEQFGDRDLKLCSGGSTANSIIGIAQLGGRAAFSASLADDKFGHFYKGEFSELGIDLYAPLLRQNNTGSCVVLVTPDSERTMRTSLAAAQQLGEEHISEEYIRNSEWIYIEGYLLGNGEVAHKAINRAIRLAKQHGTKIAITFSDGFVIDLFGAQLREYVAQADLVFANTNEALRYSAATDIDKAFLSLKRIVPNIVLTRGPDGALIHYQGRDYRTEAFACHPVDLTGAGDMFSGAFLYGITNGYEPAQAARGAAYLAMKVISKVGARLHGDIKSFWEEGIAQ